MRKSISVAMACYNGEKYIYQQIESILKQLQENDEIVISIDPSQDKTKEIIESFCDARIHCIDGPGKGLIKNFENAILHTKNEIIFLSDQDDIWLDGKADLCSYLDGPNQVLLHDCMIVDEELNVLQPSFMDTHKSKKGLVYNLIRNSYIGCCMAFTSDLKEKILPFPNIPMHDQYIGCIAEKYGQTKWIHKSYLLYRRHGNNASNLHSSSLHQQIQWRLQMIRALKCDKIEKRKEESL